MSIDNNQLYKTLGIEPTATENEIKEAYRRLSKKHHPDKGGNSDMFAELSKAYKVLVNPDTREIYDNESAIVLSAKSNISKAINDYINQCIAKEEDPYNPVLFSNVVRHFKNQLQQDRAQLVTVEAKQKRLLKMNGKVKLKKCDDVYQESIRAVSLKLKRDVDILLKNIELLETINDLLADYEVDEIKQEVMIGQSINTASSLSSCGFF